ncbi:hypothetical protein K9K83_00060 [Candidatus Woesearchaeota archaeon]|nr:hypothetical protein [Candidatus Woesearchaeota archaeon]
MNVFDKVRKVKELIHKNLPEIKEDELIIMMSHCREHYEGNLYYGRRTSNKEEKKRKPTKKLTSIESHIYDLLLTHNVNPSTCYRWFLASRVPEDIMHKVERNNMTVAKAMELARNRKRIKENKQGWQMISMIKEIVKWL